MRKLFSITEAVLATIGLWFVLICAAWGFDIPPTHSLPLSFICTAVIVAIVLGVKWVRCMQIRRRH
jgi:hypothetical protein